MRAPASAPRNRHMDVPARATASETVGGILSTRLPEAVHGAVRHVDVYREISAFKGGRVRYTQLCSLSYRKGRGRRVLP